MKTIVNRLLTAGGLAALTAAPVYASPYCIAVGGGFGNGGTTFVARNFTVPSASTCNPWTGYTKTAGTVILMTNGVACLSTDSRVLTVSVSSADPSFFGPGNTVSDYIQLCPKGSAECPIGQGNDVGYFSGTAQSENCNSELLQLPSTHD